MKSASQLEDIRTQAVNEILKGIPPIDKSTNQDVMVRNWCEPIIKQSANFLMSLITDKTLENYYKASDYITVTMFSNCLYICMAQMLSGNTNIPEYFIKTLAVIFGVRVEKLESDIKLLRSNNMEYISELDIALGIPDNGFTILSVFAKLIEAMKD